MAPNRPRALDDSRSETSSILTNLKDKAALPPVTGGAGVSKNKRNITGQNSSSKNNTIGAGADRSAVEPSPRTNWNLLPSSTLAAYRISYHLPTAPSHTHPHADMLYRSSLTAMRSPSQVQQRKRMQEARRQQRQREAQTHPSKKKLKSATDKNSDTSKENEPPETHGQNNGGESAGGDTGSPNPSSDSGIPLPPVEQIERQNPQHLAAAVRKHFNAQQLNEGETISRFIYVARNSASRDHVNTEGSAGDGHGYIMGSHGREVRRGQGGEPGFRMRFTAG